MKEILNTIQNGKIPEVPFKVTVDNDSIIKIAVAAVMAATIIILIGQLVKK